MSEPFRSILAPGEPPAVEVVNPSGRSTAVLTCDHASPRVPASLEDLGVGRAELHDHIGWDIGAAMVARTLSALLDAPLVLSGYSRLVIDCNRPPGSPTSIPDVSGGVVIPGNARVSEREARARAEECFWPYQRAIEGLLDGRRERGAPAVVLCIHSFTPVLLGQARPWDVALLHGRDRRLAGYFIEELSREPGLVVGDNEPYRVTDAGDYGVPVHCERRGLLGALIEVRQDRIADEAGARSWAERLAGVYRRIEGRLGLGPAG